MKNKKWGWANPLNKKKLPFEQEKNYIRKKKEKALNEESSLKIHPRILIKNRIGPSIVPRGTPFINEPLKKP